ncbi:DNA topoisomerase IA [Pedobacter sp. CG_S7]
MYEAKLITYPRTGSRYIGDDVFAQVPDLIQKITPNPIFGKYAKDLLNQPLNKRSVNVAKVTDHHALLPTGQTPANLPADQQAIYDMIVGRMLEAFSPECLKELTKITIESGSLFITNGTVIQSAGWRAVFNETEESAEEENTLLPKVVAGDQLPVTVKNLLEKQTKPKPFYNEASLLKAMETAGKEIEDEELRQAMKETGLGTPATRANIIETLIKRQYIVREKKNLIPSSTGLAVYSLVKDKTIAQAELTGLWEKRLEQIRTGASVSEFKAEIREFAKSITAELLETGNNISSVLQIAEQEGKITCPLCKKGAIRFNEKSAGCSEYKAGCKFVIWRTIAEKKLSDSQIKNLIEKGKTGTIKGFKSKAGKSFEAALTWADNKVEFVFENVKK